MNRFTEATKQALNEAEQTALHVAPEAFGNATSSKSSQ